MQSDFFEAPSAPAPAAPLPALSLAEDPTPYDYASRTRKNARYADLTIAIAIDFSTAGERLTQKSAGSNYLAINYRENSPEDVEQQAQKIVAFLKRVNGTKLNVAGNGIYTFAQGGIEQLDVTLRVYHLLRRVHELHPLSSVRSGGQTGVDIAGLIAAVALGIPAIGLFPNRYVQRNAKKQDRPQDPVKLEAAIHLRAQQLKQLVGA